MIKLLFSLAICLSLVGRVQAGAYRWVDDQGRVHFGDRPPDDQAMPLKLSPPAPGPGPIEQRQLDVDRKAARQKLLDTYQEERRQQHQAVRQREAEEQKRQQNCAAARDRLRRYEHASSLYRPLADGERRVLSEAERRAATERAREAVDHWCD